MDSRHKGPCSNVCPSHAIIMITHFSHEIVNMNLSDRPAWFLIKAPMGQVPVLEQNDRLVYGSEVINDYLDQVYPQNPLNAQDPYEFASQRMHREAINRVWLLSTRWYIPALVQIMAWRRPGDKPLSEAMMVNLPTHICVTRPQWVNTLKPKQKVWHFAQDTLTAFPWMKSFVV